MRNLTMMPLLMSMLLVSACASRMPSLTTTVTTPATLAGGSTAEISFEATWWHQFEDPVLDALMADAFDANRDLQAAAATVTAARELAGATRLAQLPFGGMAADGARQREGSGLKVGVELGWEADLFGRLRGRSRAAAIDAQALESDARAMGVAVAAQVASAYFAYRGAQHEIVLLGSLRERVQEQLGKTHVLVSVGRLTRLDSLRMQQIDEELAGQQSSAGHELERARLRLATLTGRTGDRWSIPDSVANELRTRVLPIGTAVDVLRRRPDIAAAALRLEAATARVGIARAELFPRVDLVGGVGLVSGAVGRLTSATAGSWLIAPRIAWSLLDWPQLQRRVRAAGALAEAAFAEYEQRVLQALEEARVAVDNHAAASAQLEAASRREDAATAAAGIVTVQYREGLVDSLARAVAERDAIAADVAANRALTAHRQSVVELYRALGGGWQ